jgi:hypothetical protein
MSCLSAFCLIALVSGRGQAQQLHGSVLSTGGVPVGNAVVAFWRGNSEIGRTFSDDSGHFSYLFSANQIGTSLLARRIGFRPSSVTIGADFKPVVVKMEPVVTPLPTEVVVASNGACNAIHGDDDAQRLLRSVAAHYLSHDPSDALRAVMSWRSEELTVEEVGGIDDGSRPPGEYATSGDARSAAYASLSREGYAIALKPGEGATILPLGAFFRWKYAALHRELSEHFIQREFIEYNRLTKRSESDGSFTIAFCGRNRRRPYVSGFLRISSDSSLVSAEWSYKTPPPDEHAGGEVLFLAPRRDAGLWQLIPARSAYWRQVGGRARLFFSETSIYREWIIGARAWP